MECHRVRRVKMAVSCCGQHRVLLPVPLGVAGLCDMKATLLTEAADLEITCGSKSLEPHLAREPPRRHPSRIAWKRWIESTYTHLRCNGRAGDQAAISRARRGPRERAIRWEMARERPDSAAERAACGTGKHARGSGSDARRPAYITRKDLDRSPFQAAGRPTRCRSVQEHRGGHDVACRH